MYANVTYPATLPILYLIHSSPFSFPSHRVFFLFVKCFALNNNSFLSRTVITTPISNPTVITMPSLIQHQKSSKYCPCPGCNSSDGNYAELEARLSPIDKYSCPACRRRFPLKQSLEAHQRETWHACCVTCNILSPTVRLHALHMQTHSPTPGLTPSPATQFRCCDCERDFKDENALANHIRSSKVHGPGKGSNKKKNKQIHQERDQLRCKKCKKAFQSQHAMEQHLSSVRHNPLSKIKCVAAVECKKQFNCPSAQLHHLESGRCVSGMTKGKLNAAIAASDTERIITSGGVTTQWLLSDSSSMTSTPQVGSPILTPASTEFLDSYSPSAILTPTSTLSGADFHPLVFTPRPRTQSTKQKCPRCPPSRPRTFDPSALQQHLSSGVHAQVFMPSTWPVPEEISFHCPRALMSEANKQKAAKNFSTVSGLTQHLESGACGGGKGTFKNVIEYVQEEMKRMGFDGLKLLG